eukprot:PhM_4_TR12216/c0_g1_i1/m.92322
MSVNHHVSDALVHRHIYSRHLYPSSTISHHPPSSKPPYNPSTTIPHLSNKGFDGYGRAALQSLVETIAYPLTEEADLLDALKYLINHATEEGKKVRVLAFQGIHHCNSVISREVSPNVDLLAIKLIATLSTIPQGTGLCVTQGGVQAALKLLRDPKTPVEVLIAAANVIRLVCLAWDGREVLLGTERGLDDATRQKREAVAQEVAQALVDIIDVRENAQQQELQLAVLQSLVQLTYAPRGIELVLMAGALRTLHRLLSRYAEGTEGDWVHERGLARSIVHQATQITWNVGMDDIGKKEAVELDVPALYGKVLLSSLTVPDELVTLKSALAGAFAAIFIYEATKSKALVVVEEPDRDVLALLLELLRQGNDLYAPMRDAKKYGTAMPKRNCTIEEAGALVTNTVQAIRLVCELPAARERMKIMLPYDTEFEIRKQLFKSTDVEDELLLGRKH